GEDCGRVDRPDACGQPEHCGDRLTNVRVTPYAIRNDRRAALRRLVACSRLEERRANGTLNQLQAAPRASGDAARPLPRLKVYPAGVNRNGRDAVANESAEALQRRAKVSAA